MVKLGSTHSNSDTKGSHCVTDPPPPTHTPAKTLIPPDKGYPIFFKKMGKWEGNFLKKMGMWEGKGGGGGC